jgi:MFS family permease
LYSLPNVILAFFIGYLADRIGRRISMLLCGCFILVSQIFFVAGVRSHSFSIAIVGRFLFGIGAETHSSIVLF